MIRVRRWITWTTFDKINHFSISFLGIPILYSREVKPKRD